MPFKIGLTKNMPSRRIKHTANTNKETYIKIMDFFTKYHKFMEFIAHRYFKDARVWRKDISDGKTEWFLLTEKEVRDGMRKIRIAMQMAFGDFSDKEAQAMV